MAEQGRAGQGRAGQGRAGQGRAGQGRAGQGRAGQGRAGQGRAGRGRAGQGSQCCIWKRVYNLQICNILTCSCSKGRFVQLCFKAKLNKASLAAAAGD